MFQFSDFGKTQQSELILFKAEVSNHAPGELLFPEKMQHFDYSSYFSAVSDLVGCLSERVETVIEKWNDPILVFLMSVHFNLPYCLGCLCALKRTQAGLGGG